MSEESIVVFRNHLQRAKHSIDLALTMRGAEALKGQPVVKVLTQIRSTLNELVSLIDEAVKNEGKPDG